jgi:hypothetical protein
VRRRRIAVTGAATLVVAAAVVAVADPFGGPSGRAVADSPAPTGLATVTRQTLHSVDQVDGTLGYSGSYTLLNQATGTYTRLPSAGDVMRQGDVAYRVDGRPVVLLYGRTPAYRALSEGMSGADVAQLNRDLVALGYATRAQLDPSSDDFGAATAAALERLQSDLGVTQTGTLALGDAVFAPRALRVASVTAKLGVRAAPGAPAATAASMRRQVVVSLDAAQQTDVRAGDRVDVTLPDQSVTPGVVSSVGRVASAGSDRAGGSGPTVSVYVRLLHPRAAGRLDQAPVQVSIRTGTARDALVVPINALLAPASGGYAVEVVGERGARRVVPVTLGLFDDADGLVQVSGSGLAAGQRVVVPAGS